jgi:YidC/Oxa1 family membrane protein insertase
VEKRAILAAVLMAAMLLIYQMLFQPAPRPEAPKEQPAAVPAPTAPGPAPQPTAPAPPPPPLPAKAPPPARSASIQTRLYEAEISSSGGKISRWELDYRGRKPMVITGILGPTGLLIQRAGTPVEPLTFSLSADSVRPGPGGAQGEIVLSGEDGFGLRVTQTLRFVEGDYAVERMVRVENRHSVPQAVGLLIPWASPTKWPEQEPESFQGQRPVRLVRLDPSGVHREDLGAVAKWAGGGQWIGLESEWYIAALIPLGPGFTLSADRFTGPAGETVTAALQASLPPLQPGQAWEAKALTYVGPKEYDRLKALGLGLEQSIFFGGFPMPRQYGGLPMEWVVVPILWAMHGVYGALGNYGIAIIVLTLVFKVLFFPLSLKSMKSMKAMQAVQPQVNALRAKYKNDAQRLQRETMELYRKHGVNPLGGCLPMVVQIPVFYALYVALSVAVELQNSPFICFGKLPAWVPGLGGSSLWICDLAAQDPTYVLPLLMGASMFIQQKMTPMMGDPRQAKIMLMMPILFTFMFLNLPSGLVLYWTLSNVLQIGQQHYMDRLARTERPPARAGKQA